MAFPQTLDNFTNPTPSTPTNSPVTPLSGQLAQLNNAVEAIEGVIGVTGSTVPTSLEYRLADAVAVAASAAADIAAHEAAADPHVQYSAASMDVNAGSVDLLTKHRMMAYDVEARKVGRLGIGSGKGVIALRFDDWQDALYTTVVPLLQARGIPYSHALISGFPTAQPTHSATTTWSNIKSMVAKGCEIWSHGFDHNDYLGYAGLVRNVVTSREEIEAQGLRVQGFSLPGVTPVYTEQQRGSAQPYDGLNSFEEWHSPSGHLLMQTYPLVESYSGGTWADIGRGQRYGRSHATIDAYSLASAKTLIDDSIKFKLSLRVMCHAGLLGTVGYMSVADYTAWLDYLVTKWDAGLIDIVTPSSLPFIDQSTNRLDLLKGDGSFAGLSQGTPGMWNNLGSTYNTVYQTGGPDNGPYLEIPSSGGSSGPNARPATLEYRGCAGETFLFEGWCKSLGAGTTPARVIIRGYPDSSQFNIDLNFASVSNSAWVLKRVPFTIPMFDPTGAATNAILIQPHRNGGDACGWANVRVVKV